MPNTILVIRHVSNTDPAQFIVERIGDGKASPAVAVPPPDSVPVPGRPNDSLTSELRWYLEKSLDYPFPPELDHAERVLGALQTWGQQAFQVLFAHPQARRSYEKAVENGFANLTLRIVSDSPVILGWPWEALHDPEIGRLAQQCEMERRIDIIRDPPALKNLPTDRVNVLLVIARPLENDVKFRAVSRTVVELAGDQQLPVSVHLLRPPTFEQLREHLRRHPNHYHILHFDGHGAYRRDPAPSGSPHIFKLREGRLAFEKEDGTPDLIEAGILTELLSEYAVPAVVLNACQSASVDERAADPFASVAAALLKAGMRSVVAMAYSLYVSGAQQFLPAFYRRLFESGNLAGAVRAGRQQMLLNQGRVCARGVHPLEDWLVPVLYQQDPLDFSFVTQATAAPPKPESRLPDEAREDRNPYGFVGRDAPLLAIERALHLPPAGILITGLGGVGKTTLARGFLKWLEQTGGLGAGALWFDFREIRSAEYVLNRLGESLLRKPEFATLSPEQKIDYLVEACLRQPLRLVWDNFESVKGIPGTAVQPNLSDADALLLKDLLSRLRGGQTKVLITSRSPEDWLGVTNIGKPMALPGLDGEERWELANIIVRDLRLRIDRTNPDLAKLMNLLHGHPLAMRVVLVKLENQTAAQLTTALENNFTQLVHATADKTEAMLFATLRFATDALPAEWQALLIPLALHGGYVDADDIERMATSVDPQLSRALVDGFFSALEQAGLLRNLASVVFELHPLFTGYLKTALSNACADIQESWVRAFVTVMARHLGFLQSDVVLLDRISFHLHGANLHSARAFADRLVMGKEYAKITNSLAVYAHNIGDHTTSQLLFQQLHSHHTRTGGEEGQAASMHQLGIVAQSRRDFGTAEQCYQSSLSISVRLGLERGAACTYHQLGMLAEDRRDFVAANKWYQKSLAITERLKMENGVATTYYQLGSVAKEQGDFATAESWYQKSLMVEERLGNENGVARVYIALGKVAYVNENLPEAESWYHKSLAIQARIGNEHAIAAACYQLGDLAKERRELAIAEEWYQKALTISERLGNEYDIANTYHQLGSIAQERQDFSVAEQWYQKSLEIKGRLRDERGAAFTYIEIASLAQKQRDYTRAEQWFQRSSEILKRIGEEKIAASACHSLGLYAQALGDFEVAEQWYLRSLEISNRLGDEYGAALTYGGLGFLAQEKKDFVAAWSQFLKALERFARLQNSRLAYYTVGNIARCWHASPDTIRPQLKAIAQQAGLPDEFIQQLEASDSNPAPGI